MPTENSPETGFAPEWMPMALVTSTPWSIAPIRSASGVVRPDSTRLVVPTPGMV